MTKKSVALGYDDRIDPDFAPFYGHTSTIGLPFRTAYSTPFHDPTPVVGESLTHQSFKDDCDINLIFERSMRGQEVTHLNTMLPRFDDLTDVPSFELALNIVIEAQTTFDALPSDLRDRFSNNPAKFLAFMDDKSNFEEAVRLGLAELPPQPPSIPENSPSGDVPVSPQASPSESN